jgi:hypothetical protein
MTVKESAVYEGESIPYGNNDLKTRQIMHQNLEYFRDKTTEMLDNWNLSFLYEMLSKAHKNSPKMLKVASRGFITRRMRFGLEED